MIIRVPISKPSFSIIPAGPEIQWTDQKQADVIDLYVYEGANGSFTLYEDENVNYNYERGLCSTIEFTYDDITRTLTIGERKGEFPGMLKERIFNVVPVWKKGRSRSVEVKYDGQQVRINLK